MKKRIIAVLICILLVSALMPAAFGDNNITAATNGNSLVLHGDASMTFYIKMTSDGAFEEKVFSADGVYILNSFTPNDTECPITVSYVNSDDTANHKILNVTALLTNTALDKLKLMSISEKDGNWLFDTQLVPFGVEYREHGTGAWTKIDFRGSKELAPKDYDFRLYGDSTVAVYPISDQILEIKPCDLWVGGVQMPDSYSITIDGVNSVFDSKNNALTFSHNDGVSKSIFGSHSGAVIYAEMPLEKIILNSDVTLEPDVKDTTVYGIYAKNNESLVISGKTLEINIDDSQSAATGIYAGDISTVSDIYVNIETTLGNACAIDSKSLTILSGSVNCFIEGIGEDAITSDSPKYVGLKAANGIAINSQSSSLTVDVGDIDVANNLMASSVTGIDTDGPIVNKGVLNVTTCPAVNGKSIGIESTSNITNNNEIVVTSSAYGAQNNAVALSMSESSSIIPTGGEIELITNNASGDMPGTVLATAGVKVFDEDGDGVELSGSAWPNDIFTANKKLNILGAQSISVSGVTINGKTESDETVNKGSTISLTGAVLPANATNQTLKWKSEDDTVATVSDNGTVTGVKAGKTVITATSDADASKKAKVNITVKDTADVTSVAITSPTTGDIYIGASKVFNATVSPDTATNKSVTWKSSDEKVATIDATGKLTAIAAGTTDVYAVSVANPKIESNKISVTVTALPAVTLSKKSTDATFTSLSGTKTLEVTVSPSNDYIESNVSWEIIGTSGICSIHETGNKLTEAVSPLKVGTTTVRAYAFKGQTNQKYVDFTVTVSSTGYAITKPSANNSLIWYYDNKSASGIIDVETNIPKSMIQKVTIGEVSVPITTSSTTGYCTLTEISGGTRLDISYNWLKANLPSKSVNYYLKVYYGTGTSDCASKLLYVRSIKDAPITGDQNMTMYSVLACVSIVMMTGVITAYVAYKKKHKNEQ